jgi:hypothetical protein
MTCALPGDDFKTCVHGEMLANTCGANGKSGILRRTIHAFSAWNQSQADQEMGRLLTRSGGRLTDDIERRAMERAMSSNFTVRR